MLFLELCLIRWLGANLVHLAYFSNFVLLGSFLGVGLGFLRASRDDPARPAAALLRAGRAARPDRVRQRLSGHGRSRVDATGVLHQHRHVRPADLGRAARRLPGRRRDHRRPGRDRGRLLPHAAAPGVLPVRPARQPGRHRVVHRAVDDRLAAAGVVRHRRRRVRRAAGTQGRQRHGVARHRTDRAVPLPAAPRQGRLLVAVLQGVDDQRRRRPRRHGVDGVGERRAASAAHVRRDARGRGAVLPRAVQRHQAQAGTGADRRAPVRAPTSRSRWRRARPTSTPSRSTRRCNASEPSTIPTTPIRTLASACTSTTGVRSCSSPTRSTT